MEDQIIRKLKTCKRVVDHQKDVGKDLYTYEAPGAAPLVPFLAAPRVVVKSLCLKTKFLSIQNWHL